LIFKYTKGGVNLAQLSNLIVTGVSRLLSKLYVSDSVTAPTFIGKLQGNADTATKATSADSATTVVDYGNTSKNIKIGYSGSGITGDNIKFIAGYTGGDGGSNIAKIKDVSKDALKSWLGLGSLAYSSATIPSVGNGTVTVKQNGTSKGTFTMNQSGNTTIELTDNNTVYTHPSYTAKSSGLYKVTVDATGHVSAATAVTKADITGLGIPGSDTNTDTKVTQAAVKDSDYTNWRSLVWGASNSATEGFSPTTVTDQVFSSAGLSVQPSSGTIRATTFKGALSGNASTATNASKVNNHTVNADVPSGAKFTDTVYTHPTTSGNKHIPSGGSSGQILRWSADGTAVWGADNNTTYSNFVKSGSGAKAGLVPAPSTTAGTTKYLREDGTWTVPPDNNTTYSNMTAATASAAGKAGLVPAPAAGKQASFLRGDGTWVVPTNTTYSTGTTSTAGLTKLYTGTGTATDGTMTQSTITTALNGKAASSHTHDDRYYTESEINTKLGDLSSLSSYGSDVTSILKAIIAKLPETYSGSYSVTPSATTQSLSTSGKVMKDNVSVSAIPYKEESNSSGTTVTIG
jgi:hypothetical protein